PRRQSLILMAEIALTVAFLDRFAARFGVRPAEWHSELSPRQRARTWHAVAARETVVLGGAHLRERCGAAELPAVEAIDLKREGPPRGRFVAPRLAEAVRSALEREE